MAVTLDFDASIEKISAKIQSTQNGLRGMSEDYRKVGEASNAAIKKAVNDQDALGSSTVQAGKKLKDQAGIIEKLEDHLKRLEIGQRKAQDIPAIRKYNTEIAKTRAALASLRGASTAGFGAAQAGANAAKVAASTLGTTLRTAFAPLLAVTAATEGIRQIISLVTEYEQVAADLSAVTGANGDTLEFLKQSAVEVGTETTISAAKTLKAYELIASAKPELLSNAEGLANITREAVRLAEATGGELPETALNLADIMNKMGADASRAAEFVNVLAAGSQAGSAPVDSLAASFKVAGTEMNQANISFQEGAGTFEVLATQGLKFSEAGTAVRNVVSKLSATDILPKNARERLQGAGVDIAALSDKTLSFSDRLRALQPIQNDANALTAVFGLENKSAATILIQNADAIDKMTEAVTGTNVAQEQAATRTATASAEWTKLGNTVQAVIQGATNGLGPLLAFIIRFVREGVLFVNDAIQILRPSFSSVAEAVGGLFSALRALLPLQEDAGEGANFWKTAVEFLTVPLRVLLFLVGTGIGIITNFVQGWADLVGQSPFLTRFFESLKNQFLGFINLFINFPAYLQGTYAAITTFIDQTKQALSNLGQTVGNIFKEAFNINQIIADGGASLKNALKAAISNPFAGVGAASAEAFKREFDKAKKPLTLGLSIGGTDAPAASATPAPSPTSPSSGSGAATTAKKNAEEATKAAEAEAKKAEQIEKDRQRLVLAAMKDGVDKQLALEDARFADLSAKLENFGIDTEQARQQHELNKFEIRSSFIEQTADLEGLSGEERISFLFNQTKAEIDAIERALADANGGELLAEQQKQINLLRQKASEEYLTQLKEFQDTELQEEQKHKIALLELRSGDFDSIKEFEKFKQEEILKIKLESAEAQLAIIENLKGAEDSAALALRQTINQIKGDLEGIKQAGTADDFNLYGLFGLDPNNAENAEVIKGIETAAETAVDVISQINDLRLKTAEAAIEASQREIEAIEDNIAAKQEELADEEALAEQGLANNADRVQQEIDALKAQKAQEKAEQQKALKEKQKIQKQQAIIDTITQASSLITAAANVFNSVSAIPFIGPVLGAALVAAMIGSFIAAKAKVFQSISTQTAEKGMTGVVTGRRHSQGGEKFGDHIEVEEGEAFGVLSRPATKKYGKQYMQFVNAANANNPHKMGEVLQMFVKSPKIDPSLGVVIQQKETQADIVKNNIAVKVENRELKENNKELKRSNKLLKQMLQEQQKTVHYEGESKVTSRGRSSRVVKRKR